MAAFLGAGVLKMNVDTGVQWAHWDGIKNVFAAKEGCLEGQIESPEGADKSLRVRGARGVFQRFWPVWFE